MLMVLNNASISELWQAMDKKVNPPVPKDSVYGQLSWESDQGKEVIRCTFNGYFEEDLSMFSKMNVPLIIKADVRFDVFNRDTMINVSDLDISIDKESLNRSLEFVKQAIAK